MKRNFMFVLIFVMAILFDLPVVGQRLQTPKKDVFPSLEESLKQKLYNPVKARQDFRKALDGANVSAMEELVKEYPDVDFFSGFMKDKNGEAVSALCIAAEQGQDKVLDYVIEKKPSLLKEKCGRGRDALVVAIENGQAETAVKLLSLKIPVNNDLFLFMKTADHINGMQPLKKLIAALLDHHVDYSKQTYINNYSDRVDAFFIAAQAKKRDFVVALHNELKNRGLNPISQYTIIDCPDYHATDWGLAKDQLDKSRAIEIERIKNSEEGVFLKKNGVAMKVSVEFVDSDDCY